MLAVRGIVFAALLSLGAISLATACGSSTESGTTGVTSDAACTELASGLCSKISSCASFYLQIGYGDVANCQVRAKLDCMQSAVAPSTATTPADISACAKSAASLSCEDLLNDKLPSECTPKPGGLDNGRACSDDSQCKSTFCGYDSGTKLCGVCAEKPAEGGACVDGKCPMGLTCAASKCVKRAAEGGTCSDSIPCLTGLTCVGTTCKKNVQNEGEACDDKGVTAANCDGTKGLLCLASKCFLAKVVGDGQPCGLEGTITALTGATVCEKTGYCNGVDLQAMPRVLMGTCSPAAKDGDTCVADASVFKGPGCVEPAECIDGKCRLPDSAACK